MKNIIENKKVKIQIKYIFSNWNQRIRPLASVAQWSGASSKHMQQCQTQVVAERSPASHPSGVRF